MCIWVGSVVQVTEQTDTPTLDSNISDTVSGTNNGFYGLGGDDDMTFVQGTIGLDTAPVTTTFMYGGEGNDTLTFQSGTTGTLSGDAGDDTITFNGSGRGALFGGDGDDDIFGGAKGDYIEGGRGEDLMRGFGGADVMAGGAASDVIGGAAGKDTLDGGGGSDSLTGGGGRDVMTGGAGSDTFIFLSSSDSGNTSTTRDVVTDFNAGTSSTTVDKIFLSFDAIEGGDYNGFTFVTGAFTAAGQIRVVQSGDNALVQVNTSGPSQPELVVQLNGVQASDVTAADVEWLV
jgi:Ca2+-binding RTX toxin-like protein